MSRIDNPAAATLTRAEMHTIMPCFGNLSMTKLEATVGGIETEHVFDPPYRLRHGQAYAIRRNAAGGYGIWEVERRAKGVWHWIREADREAETAPCLHSCLH